MQPALHVIEDADGRAKGFSADSDPLTGPRVDRWLGIGIVPEYAAAANPDLVPILKDRFQVEVPMWIVAHRELHTSRRIRLVFDALAEGISSIGGSSRAGQPR